jgi:hypothetical protein
MRLIDDTLDAQIKYIRHIDSLDAREYEDHVVEFERELPAVRKIARNLMPFGVSKDVMPLIIEGGKQLPETTRFVPSMLQVPYGFAYFPDRIVKKHDWGDGYVNEMRAIVWMVANVFKARNNSIMWDPTVDLNDIDDKITGVTTFFLDDSMAISGFVTLPFGGDLKNAGNDTQRLWGGGVRPFGEASEDERKWDRETGQVLYRCLFSLFLFMQETIISTTEEHASRHAQRRAARTAIHFRTVRIVHLRASEHRSCESMGQSSFEYSCRFLVRGHWRNQWHPSDGSHRPKWVVPHWKGPADAPVKIPQIVFAVDR